MKPTSISTLADYCMQQLGAPVIDIHVAEEQVLNRIEDALDFFQEFHGDSTERTFLKHVVRGNEIVTPAATSFTQAETVTGSVSGATALVKKTATGLLIVGTPSEAFIPGETITGNISGANSVVTSFTIGDIDNGFIPVSPAVVAITNIYPINSSHSNGQFSASYQLRLESIYSLQRNGFGGGLSDYDRTKQYLNTLDNMLVGEKLFRFKRHMHKLHVDMDWVNIVEPGDIILAECFRIIDPEEYAAIFNDRMLKKLATAYIKKQWGSNMKLHSGIQLPGGITVNGQTIYDEAMAECEKIEEDIRDTYEEPVNFLVG